MIFTPHENPKIARHAARKVLGGDARRRALTRRGPALPSCSPRVEQSIRTSRRLKEMKSIQKNLAALAIAAFGIGFAPSAGARSVSGWSGEPQNLENGGCFSE